MDNNKKRELLSNILTVILIAFSFVITTWFIYRILYFDVESVRNGPPTASVDWKGTFQKAALALLAGESPYTVSTFHNPPWLLLPLMPIALFSSSTGSAIIFMANLYAYIFVIIRLRMNKWLIIPYVIFSGMLANSANGNIEGLLALGFLMAPTIGLFFVLIKPQIGFAVALYWLFDEIQNKGLKSAVKLFLPVTLAFGISFIIWGFWPISASSLIDVWWNASIWPRGLPLGILLLILAIRKHEIKLAIAASPFLSPYLTGHTWAFVWLGLLSLKRKGFDLSSLKRKYSSKFE